MMNGNHEDEDDDDDDASSCCSVEGRIARCLFRTDSDSVSDVDHEENNNNNDDDCNYNNGGGKEDRHYDHHDEASSSSSEKEQYQTEDNSTNGRNRRRRRKIMNTTIEEELVGGSIAHKVWPAAEYLASFVLDFVSQNCMIHDNYKNNCDNSTNNNTRRAENSDCRNGMLSQRYVGVGKNNQPRQNSMSRDENNNKSEEVCQVLHDLRNILLVIPCTLPNSSGDIKPTDGGTTIITETTTDVAEVEIKSSRVIQDLEKETTIRKAIRILEIGAGTGLTGLELATQLPSQLISSVVRHSPRPSTNDNNNNDDDCSATKSASTSMMVPGIHVRLQVLLTDLELALPLLRRNIELNIPYRNHKHNSSCNHNNQDEDNQNKDNDNNNNFGAIVHAQKLDWTNKEDCEAGLDWFRTKPTKQFTTTESHSDAIRTHDDRNNNDNISSPLLIIGSDCVYWECLHEPLERCLYNLLSQSPTGSICLLAGMRRWKRDTAFYNRLNRTYVKQQKRKEKRNRKNKSDTTHQCDSSSGSKNSNVSSDIPLDHPSLRGYLVCTCLDEQVTRHSRVDSNNNNDKIDQGGREIMRIYAVRYHSDNQQSK